MKKEKFLKIVKDSVGISTIIYGINAIAHKVDTENTLLTQSLLTPEVITKSAFMGLGIFIAKAFIAYISQKQDSLEQNTQINSNKVKP